MFIASFPSKVSRGRCEEKGNERVKVLLRGEEQKLFLNRSRRSGLTLLLCQKTQHPLLRAFHVPLLVYIYTRINPISRILFHYDSRHEFPSNLFTKIFLSRNLPLQKEKSIYLVKISLTTIQLHDNNITNVDVILKFYR